MKITTMYKYVCNLICPPADQAGEHSYKAAEKDIEETEYLSASPAMKKHLDKAAQQEKNGEGAGISLDDIWK